MKKEDIKKGIYILPNLFTTANIFCGFFAIIRTINGDYLVASWVLFLAGLFDFLDGRVARLTKTHSEFGLEYDSLSDLTSFGIAPAILLYKWALFNFGRFGWAAAFLFFACGALRLARYNVQAGDVERKNFQGLPIPAGAACIVSYVIFHYHVFGPGPTESYFILFLTFVVALLMVSNIPYTSFKVLDKGRRANFFLLVIVVGVIFLIASAPQILLFAFAMTYAAAGIVIEVVKSPRKIAGFSDFMARYFHVHPKDLGMEPDDKNEKPSLKVVGMKSERSHEDEEEE